MSAPPHKRPTEKYYRFHHDHGHETSKCFQLKEHIESLIKEGHLNDYLVRKDDGRGSRTDEKKDLPQRSPRKGSLIHTISGGPNTGHSNREMKVEIREVSGKEVNLTEHP